MKTPQELYDELSYYTLSHKDPRFIHQHIVDAFTAQQANKNTKPIAITFALVGLYLFLEKNFTGKQVQQAHMQMARKRKTLPTYVLPEHRGDINVSDVLAIAPGQARDDMIRKWCISVWNAYKQNHEKIIDLTKTVLFNR